MRKNGVLTYILGDHLGSTSLVTDSSGNVINQTKYKAWGETRYSSGTNPSEYTFTGQYSYTNDFGLMFYNARWYDPSLGRFAQADSIIPTGVQGLDRYSYTFNNPVIYIDPSGHVPADCYGTGYCGSQNSNLLSNGKRKVVGLGKTGVGTKDEPTVQPDGTLYVQTKATSNAEARRSTLSSKAESSYTDYGFGGGNLLPITNNPAAYSIDLINNGTSVASDFASDIEFYPVYIATNWSQSEGGLIIHDIEINNTSPTIVTIDNVSFSYTNQPTHNDAVIYGDPANQAGGNGNLVMNIAAVIPDNIASITINLSYHGGFPSNNEITIDIYSQLPGGCYVVPNQ